MSTDLHKTGHEGGVEPTHADVAFEERDVTTSSIYAYLAILAIAVILSYVVCIYVLRVTASLARADDPQPPPVRQELGKEYREMPPEPRLQGVPGHETDPQYDSRLKREEDTAANNRYGWIDKSAGIAQIPVSDAMKIIAEKGLPAVSTEPAEKKK